MADRTVSQGPPSFASEEELKALLLEGLNSGEGVEMIPEEWRRLYEELAPGGTQERRAS